MAATATAKGLEFDPGFAPHILAFRGTVEILYSDINRFKNFSQKKLKFMQYHKKILDVFYNNYCNAPSVIQGYIFTISI